MHLLDYEHDSAGNLAGLTVNYDGEIITLERVRHGRWEWKDGKAYCTAHKGKTSPDNYGYGYCPLCGAKMDGGKEDADAT